MSTRGAALDARSLRALFQELSSSLHARGVQAQLFVVGGAAMALAYDQDRLTRDVDALFVPALVVRQIAADISASHGLEPDWLNDAVKGFLPGRRCASGHGVRIRVVAGAGALTGVSAGNEVACLPRRA